MKGAREKNRIWKCCEPNSNLQSPFEHHISESMPGICYTTGQFKVVNLAQYLYYNITFYVDSNLAYKTYWEVKLLIKRGLFLQAGLQMQLFIFNQASIVSVLRVIQLQQAGCVLFLWRAPTYSGPLPENGNIPVGGRGERERHRACSRGTGTRADGEEGCPGGSDLLELCANSPHQSLSSLNALKGEETECAVYRSNTHLSVPQDRLRHTHTRWRAYKQTFTERK